MTEADWLACNDPQRMLAFLGSKASNRKLYLFAVACCRRVWYLFDRSSRYAVEMSEGFADGAITEQQRVEVASWMPPVDRHSGLHNAAFVALTLLEGLSTTQDVANLLDHLSYAIKRNPHSLESWFWPITSRAHAALLRDIFGPLAIHRIAADPSWLAWNSGTVLALAQAIYDERAFDRMPILADSLEDAGCTDQEILAHCRGPGRHGRGCWVLDLLLSKE